MAVDVGSAVGYLDLDISGFLAGLKSAQSEADTATKNIATKIGNNISGFGKGLTSVGTTLTKNVTVPLVGIGVAGLKTATDFEKGMSQVKAISGATGKDFDALREKAIELGADTAFSANTVAEAMSEMAKAGWSSQQIIDGMSGVLDAAAASGEGLGIVSTIIADAITGFGLEAKDSARIADLLTQAANSGTIGITDLGESFKYIAPVASSMGLSVEDITTALSGMSMAGIKGSQAGTSLRTMLTRMIKPTDAVASAMDELGIVLTNSDGSFKSLDTIVAEMRSDFSGLTDEQKAYYAATLAGQEGMSGLLSLLNLTQEEYDAIAESMDNASGVAAETAAVMQDNLQSKVEQLGGSLESLAIKLGDHVIPHLQTFVVWLTSVVDKFAALNPETQSAILKFAGIAAIIGPVLVAFGKLSAGIGGLVTTFGKIPGAITALKTGFTGLATGFKNINEGAALAKAGFPALGAEASKLGVVIGGITAPIAAVIAIIATLAAAFISLWKNNEEFRNNITAIWNEVKAKFESFAQGIVDRLNALGFDFASVTDLLKTIWQGFCDFLAPVFEGAFSIVSSVLGVILDTITGSLDIFIGLFTGNWEQFWNGVKGIFSGVWNAIVGIFTAIGNTLLGILNTVCGWFGTTWTQTWNSIKTFFVNTWNSIVTFVTNALNVVRNTIANVFNSVKSSISSIWNGIKTTISSVVNSIKSTISNGFTSAKNTVVNIFSSIKNSISNVMNSAKSIVSNAINNIKSKFNFKWSLPKLKMPHPKVRGKFSLNPPSVPKFSIEWYKKAMDNGMILDAATIFGFNSNTGKFLAGGEAGSETVVGTKSLLNMIKQTVHDAIGPLVLASRELAMASAELGYVTYNGFTKFKEFKERQDGVSKNNNDGNGDTFVFYSPKAIDEIEAAKQMKKTKRELAEGF